MTLENKSSDRAGELNEAMRAAYARRCQQEAGNFPVIIDLADGTLIFRGEGYREECCNPLQTQIDLLKNIAHLPLLNFLLCAEPSHAADDRENDETLAEALPALKAQIGATFTDRADRELLSAIVARSAPEAGDSAALEAQREMIGNLLRKAIRRGAELRLKGMHQTVSHWAKRLDQKDWDGLRVVIASSHAARKDNLSEQYFLWLLGEPAKQRILIAEGIDDEASAVNCIGAKLVDAKVGKLFFDDSAYLHRDVLAAPVPELLGHLPPIVFADASAATR